ncbi:MAG: hypothetical protein AB7N24_23690 [Dehalococcoidia bacterium]
MSLKSALLALCTTVISAGLGVVPNHSDAAASASVFHSIDLEAANRELGLILDEAPCPHCERIPALQVDIPNTTPPLTPGLSFQINVNGGHDGDCLGPGCSSQRNCRWNFEVTASNQDSTNAYTFTIKFTSTSGVRTLGTGSVPAANQGPPVVPGKKTVTGLVVEDLTCESVSTTGNLTIHVDGHGVYALGFVCSKCAP